MKSSRIELSVPWWRNSLINGNAALWQRGTTALTLSTSRQYRADRFYAYDTAGTTATIQQSAAQLPTNNLSDYAILITGGTGTTDLFVGQCIESFNAHSFVRERFLAFSCWLYNSTGAAFTPVVQFRPGNANDTFASGAFTNATLASGSCSNGVWTQVKGILDLSSLSNINYGLQVEIKIPSGSLDTNGKLVYLTQFMLNPGNEYAPFMMASGWDISEEIRKCQRYYESICGYNLAFPQTSSPMCQNSRASVTSELAANVRFSVAKRNDSSSIRVADFAGTLGYCSNENGTSGPAITSVSRIRIGGFATCNGTFSLGSFYIFQWDAENEL